MYLGNQPATNFETVRKDRFTGLTGTDVTLSYGVSSVNDIIVWVNSVKQDYNSYSVSGTTLTLGGSLVSSDFVEIAYLGRTFQTVNPPAGSVGLSQLSATGTKDSTTFLRGDNTFASAGGTNTPAFRILKTATQSITAATLTKVTFDSTAGNGFDTNSGFDDANDKWTIPSGEGGKYFVSWWCAWTNTIDQNADIRFEIRRYNSSDVIQEYLIKGLRSGANGNWFGSHNLHGVLNASAGDYFNCYFYSSTAITLDGSSYETALSYSNAESTNFYGYKLVE